MPLCQRCLGLYAGVVLTVIWVVTSGIWLRGLGSWSVFLVNVAMLVAAMLGGLHIIDVGPTWRVACGLMTGHVVVLWLAAGTSHLWIRSRPNKQQLVWRGRDKLQGLILPIFLVALSAGFPPLLRLGWYFWTAFASAGAAIMLILIVLGGGSLLAYSCTGKLTGESATQN